MTWTRHVKSNRHIKGVEDGGGDESLAREVWQEDGGLKGDTRLSLACTYILYLSYIYSSQEYIYI